MTSYIYIIDCNNCGETFYEDFPTKTCPACCSEDIIVDKDYDKYQEEGVQDE